MNFNSIRIKETIERGDQKASTFYDFPTANIKNTIHLPCGMYTANSNYGDAVCLVLHPDTLECHIKNFDENIYGKTLQLANIEQAKDDNLAKLINVGCRAKKKKSALVKG